MFNIPINNYAQNEVQKEFGVEKIYKYYNLILSNIEEINKTLNNYEDFKSNVSNDIKVIIDDYTHNEL